MLFYSIVSLSTLSNLSGSEFAKKLGQADLATLKNAVQTGAGKVFYCNFFMMSRVGH